MLTPELLAHRDDEREREHEEAARILYVAATRARDLLVVPVIGDERREGWLGALHSVVYPDEARRRQPETATPIGCPRFGLDSVATRPERAPGRERSVAPGTHVPEVGDHRVVWWDPAMLAIDVEETVGLRQQKLLEADESGATSERGVRAHAAWRASRARVRADAGQPTMRVATATAWAATCAEPAAPPPACHEVAALAAGVTVERVAARAGSARPHGASFGVLVHAVLAVVDLDADADAIVAATALQARLFGAHPDERAAASGTVRDALAHPLLRRAAAAARAGRCRREVALALTLEDGTLIEGVADLVFRDETSAPWTIVDFKTDRDLDGPLSAYRWQLGAYAHAVARATGEPTTAVVLGV